MVLEGFRILNSQRNLRVSTRGPTNPRTHQPVGLIKDFEHSIGQRGWCDGHSQPQIAHGVRYATREARSQQEQMFCFLMQQYVGRKPSL